MLFNAPEFLFVFLPVVVIGFYLIGATGRTRWAIYWLIAASLFFYSWWRLDYLPLLLGSLAFNFVVGLALSRNPRRWLLVVGIAGNLGALGWFKYSGFLAELANDLSGAGLPIPQVILPLAISFYTFQQIAYLVDAHAGTTGENSFARYALFVVFFPQLIAGPIVHHREMLEQFRRPETYRPQYGNLMLGLAAFGIGLFKKVFIADPLSPLANFAFGPAAGGTAPAFADAWFGSVAYTLQLYFDFSGYSDMAIGLGLMFGIRLPVNFSSPFKAASIIEFWSRWHMTLTRFMTNYVYSPLVMALTRRRVSQGKPLLRRSAPSLGPFLVLLVFPTLFTMGLMGVWHGAGWQFVVFGLLHGVFLVVNHGWRAVRHGWSIRSGLTGPARTLGVLVTFLAVTVSLVFFRAESLEQALLVVGGMAGFGEPANFVPQLGGPDPATMGPFSMLLWRVLSLQGLLVMAGLVIIWTLPNTAQFIEHVAERAKRQPGDIAALAAPVFWPFFRPHRAAVMLAGAEFLQGGVVGTLLALALLRAVSGAPSEFLYFTF